MDPNLGTTFKVDHYVLSLLFKIKHVSMDAEKRFDRALRRRSWPYNDSIKLLQLAYLPLPCDVITGHYRSPQNPHLSKKWSGRCGLQLHTTATANQHCPLSSLRCRHFGVTFLSAVTTTPRHQPRSQRHWQIECIVQSTHCMLLAWLVHMRRLDDRSLVCLWTQI